MNLETQMIRGEVPESDAETLKMAQMPENRAVASPLRWVLLCIRCRTTIEGRARMTKEPICFDCKRKRNALHVWNSLQERKAQ